MKPLHEYLEIASLLAPSLATAAATAIGGSQVGTFVLLRREGMMALAFPQIVAVGAALSLRWGMQEYAETRHWPSWLALIPALAAAMLAVTLLAWSRRRATVHWLLPSLYVAGLCLSFLIIANGGAHVAEMQNLFTGIDVSVSADTALISVVSLLGAGLVTSLLWRRWLALAQIPAAAELAGLNPVRWDAAFLCLLAATLLFATSALGAVMILAMLFLPAATVTPWLKRIPPLLIAAAATALLFLALGFVASIEMEWPLSQSVGGVGFALLLLSHIVRAAVRSAKH